MRAPGHCIDCGNEPPNPRMFRCWPCYWPHIAAQTKAAYMVAKAVRKGELPDPKTLICVDCGAAAIEYDHRDYSEPLAVDSVCHPCNIKRGPAQSARGSKPQAVKG